MAELENIVTQVIEVSKKAGAFIQAEAAIFQREHIQQKGLNDLVSYVDKEAEKIIVAGLAEILPEAGFIAEEGTSEKRGSQYNWIIDPLDGTTNFIHGLPIYAVSIALARNDEPVLGVIYEISKKDCFYAVEGGKAFLNDKEIAVSPIQTLAESLIATGFPFREFDYVDKYLALQKEFMRCTHGVRRMGSAAIDMAYVACGRFEGFFESNLKPWDIAAGIIILKQAGGMVTDYQGGNNYLFGGEVVAAGKVHNEMLKVVQDKWGH